MKRIIICLVSVLLFNLAGCSSEQSTETNKAASKGLQIKLNFNGNKSEARSLNYVSPDVVVRDRTEEIKLLVKCLQVWVWTEDDIFVNTYSLKVENGVITDGPIQLNIGRYNLQIGAYSERGTHLYSATTPAEIFNDGSGSVAVNLELVSAFAINVHINNIPGYWTISDNYSRGEYNVQVSVISARGKMIESTSSGATIVQDENQNQNLLFTSSALFSYPFDGDTSFDPTVKLFFKINDNYNNVYYGEYKFDVINCIMEMDQKRFIDLQYPKIGDLIIESF